MLTLYGSQRSGSAAVEMALKACNLPCRKVRASTWEPDSARDKLLRVNPLGQIPTLVLEDGTVLTESAAILIHLGLMHPEAGLLPAAPAARAQALRGLVYIAANCYSAIGIIDYPERWTTSKSKAERERVRNGARLRLHANWEIFADLFTATPYLTGERPGVLDYLAVVVSRWSKTREHLATARPRLLEVLERVEADQMLKPIMRRHFAE